MKALPTQFDDKRLSNAVATPTCSSCCCCCCCLATAITASSLLAQRIDKEGEKHQVPERQTLTVIAALFIPIVGALTYLGHLVANSLFRICTPDSTFQYSGSTVCSKPGARFAIPLAIVLTFSLLLFLYSRVRIEKPIARAAIVTPLIVGAFALELIVGMTLITTGGHILYIALVPTVAIGLSAWYYRVLNRKPNGGSAPSAKTTHR